MTQKSTSSNPLRMVYNWTLSLAEKSWQVYGWDYFPLPKQFLPNSAGCFAHPPLLGKMKAFKFLVCSIASVWWGRRFLGAFAGRIMGYS